MLSFYYYMPRGITGKNKVNSPPKMVRIESLYTVL